MKRPTQPKEQIWSGGWKRNVKRQEGWKLKPKVQIDGAVSFAPPNLILYNLSAYFESQHHNPASDI